MSIKKYKGHRFVFKALANLKKQGCCRFEYHMAGGGDNSKLRKLAHDLDPLVYIGKSDLTENIFNEMDRLLESRELVKVKIQESSLLEPKETANEMAKILGAEFVQAIGRKFTLYRRAKEDPQIVLPR